MSFFTEFQVSEKVGVFRAFLNTSFQEKKPKKLLSFKERKSLFQSWGTVLDKTMTPKCFLLVRSQVSTLRMRSWHWVLVDGWRWYLCHWWRGINLCVYMGTVLFMQQYVREKELVVSWKGTCIHCQFRWRCDFFTASKVSFAHRSTFICICIFSAFIIKIINAIVLIVKVFNTGLPITWQSLPERKKTRNDKITIVNKHK